MDESAPRLEIERTMKSHTEYFTFHTKKKRELVHLTPKLEERGRHEDIWKWLEGIAPFREDYKHQDTGEDNGDAHSKSLPIHHEVIVPITKGQLDLGTWQRVFCAELDGQRSKRLIVKVLGE